MFGRLQAVCVSLLCALGHGGAAAQESGAAAQEAGGAAALAAKLQDPLATISAIETDNIWPVSSERRMQNTCPVRQSGRSNRIGSSVLFSKKKPDR